MMVVMLLISSPYNGISYLPDGFLVLVVGVGGNYLLIGIVKSAGKFLGAEATVEDVAQHFDAIADLAKAKPKDSAA